MWNIKKILVSFLIILVGLIVIIFIIKNIPSREEVIAREIIQSYMEANNLDIKPGSDEYKVFMRRIIWGEFPELSDVRSDFIKTTDELRYVSDFAWKYSGYEEQYGGNQIEEDLQEAVLPTSMD